MFNIFVQDVPIFLVAAYSLGDSAVSEQQATIASVPPRTSLLRCLKFSAAFTALSSERLGSLKPLTSSGSTAANKTVMSQRAGGVSVHTSCVATLIPTSTVDVTPPH
jgi:hypothetical protein